MNRDMRLILTARRLYIFPVYLDLFLYWFHYPFAAVEMGGVKSAHLPLPAFTIDKYVRMQCWLFDICVGIISDINSDGGTLSRNRSAKIGGDQVWNPQQLKLRNN
jgi:hypothetical protein